MAPASCRACNIRLQPIARIAYFCGQKTRDEMSGANKPEPIDCDKKTLLEAMKRRFG